MFFFLLTCHLIEPYIKAQIKHMKNFSINNFGPPKTPPPKNCLCLGFFLHFEGEGGPKHKEFTGSGVPWRGGSGRGFSGEIAYVYAFFRGLIYVNSAFVAQDC